MTPSTIIKTAIGAVAAITILSVGACSMTTVDTGTRGVVVKFGEPVGTFNEGLHFINPLTTEVVTIPVRQLKWNGETLAYTEDVQQADIEFSLTYSLNPESVLDTYQSIGEGWANIQVPQVVYESIKSEFGNSEAVADAIQQRGVVQSRIRDRLVTQLAARNIIVHGFELTDITFSEEFEAANEEKQVAVERANAATNHTVRIQEEARQRVITAQAEADAMRIRGEALSRNPALTDYEAVRKWNGELPTMMLGGATPFINVN